MKRIPTSFQEGSFISSITPINGDSHIGRARVRLFYKYANRNGSYITDEVAESIIRSAPTTPVIGFYDKDKGDFGSHVGPDLSKCYGFISEQPNFAWEKHLDKDGVEREYACFDVILHCDYFPEANLIVDSNESMELNADTIDGDWGEIDGNEYFIYTNAVLRGVCVLGKQIEPCFEGSAFFALNNYEKFSALLFELQEQVEKIEGETKKMEMEELQKEENFEEQIPAAAEETVEETVEEQTEEFAEKKDEEEEEKKEESEDESTEEEDEDEEKKKKEEEESEMKKKDGCHSLTDEEYELLISQKDEFSSKLDASIAENAALKEKLATQDAQFAELNTKFNELMAKLDAAQNTINSYEHAKENAKKEELFASYAAKVSAEDLSAISTLKEQASYEELETKLALCFARSAVEFNKKTNNYVPHADPEESEFARIISKYKKNK